MGSRSFRFIRPDGSRPSMTVGGDIKAYENCLHRFKDAWQTPESTKDSEIDVIGQGQQVSQSILQQVQAAYLKGSWPRRQPRLVRSH